MKELSSLLEHFHSRRATIGIVGMGYVGLPLMLRFSQAGFRVLGLDIDAGKVEKLNAGQSYIAHISSEEIAGAKKKGFVATCDFQQASEADALIVCVPTPLNKNREPDLSFVIGTMESLSPHLRAGQVLSLESTTYPGTTQEELLPRIEKTGLQVGRDFFLVYSPEREDPGSRDFNPGNIPKVIGGHSPACLKAGMALYSPAVETLVPVSSTRAAEMTKLLENIFRSVNIALVNELKVLCLRMNIDIHEVIRAAATKPFGFMPFYPGPGLGGHCIPIDPFYLTWKAREYDVATRFIELAGEVNTAMPAFVVTRVMEVLNEQGKPLKGADILLLGLAYKAGVDDDRESPTYRIMLLLEEKGANVAYNDPHVPMIRPSREYSRYAGRSSQPLPGKYDLYILCTAHQEYAGLDPDTLPGPVLDTRGFFPDRAGKVFRA